MRYASKFEFYTFPLGQFKQETAHIAIIISLISHWCKVMPKLILNRLKPHAREIITEEKAGFRAGRSTTDQVFSLRILCEKHLQHQQICTMSLLISQNLRQSCSMACSLMGHHAEEQYQCKSSWHYLAALKQGYKCSPDE